MAFPSVTGEMLAAGRYRSSPPFDVDFTFEVPDGWESMHLHGEFFDIGWFGDAPRPGPPEKWIAFGLPEHVQGAEDVPVGDLTPAEAVELLRSRTDLTATEPEAFTLDGRDGLRLDLHAAEPNTVLFGGPAGEFGIEPSQDVRIGFVPHGDRLLAVLVLAAPDALDAAWADAQPILDSVELP